MNKFMNVIKAQENFGYTENGAVCYKSTGSALYDLFSMGGAFRTRTDDEVIHLFKKAFEENEPYAMKCLFYLRSILDGQGERRFFRVVMHWLATAHSDAVKRNIDYFADFGRWDDLFCLMDTPCQDDALMAVKKQLAEDLEAEYPSLLAKWLPSPNTSSVRTKALAKRVRNYLGMTEKQYRKTLSYLRKKINVLERLMSANEWDKIDYSKIPSRAGMLYRKAFAKHDVERQKAGVKTYEEFAKDETAKVNAKALYPYECVAQAIDLMNNYYREIEWDNTDRLMINKYWANLTDYIKNAKFNGLAVVDTSGSMMGGYGTSVRPIDVAISLGMYCAEKNKGPFANHFLTFSSSPAFKKVEGVDFCDKVKRMMNAPWGGTTNIERAFDLILDMAIKNNCAQADLPQNLIIISDMEFDNCATSNMFGPNSWGGGNLDNGQRNTLFEKMRAKWRTHGYEMPKLIFWNCCARSDNFAMRDEPNVSYVSGFSPTLFAQIMSGKTAQDLMFDKLNEEKYNCIH